MQNSKVINLVVGGNNFCFKKEDLERFPDSYFAHFLKDEWIHDRSAVMHIHRSGLIFYNVFSYIVNDSLGFRGETFSLETLVAIRREADFYNLPGMIAMCDERISSHIGQWCTRAATDIDTLSRFTCEPENSSNVSPIFRALNDAVRPAAVATSTAKLVFLLPSFGALLVPSNRHSHRYVDVSSCFSQYIRLRVQNECGIWLDGQDTNILMAQRGIHLYLTGGYCSHRRPMFTTNGRILKGINLYIPHTCVYTGGKITAMGCGQVMCMEKPGECMCMRAGMSYSVETVTSGKLVVMEVEIYNNIGGEYPIPYDPSVEHLKFTTSFSQRPGTKISPEQRTNLTTALNTELIDYSAGVIICLTSLYPITHSPDPDNNHIYTDPEALKGKDAVLYSLLRKEYAVTIVSVFLCRAIADSSANRSHTLVGCIVDSSLPETEEGAMHKIVPVVYGYGEPFRVDGQKMGTLLTGLLVSANK